MGTSRVRLLCACGAVALIAGLDAPALAQDRPAAAMPANSSSTSTAASEPAPAAAADQYQGTKYKDDIIVTAQKRSESMQKVPISMSAFSAEDLNKQKIESGGDLMKAVPNLTFSKSNFASYNLSIRGIGTKAISTTTDPGVAVSFNNTGLIHNRLFEQEYFDVERVEVLRGPQGTLYGRNATAGVVNVISAKAKLDKFEGSIKAEVGNYNSRRLVGMLNIPLVDGVLGVRLAGSTTQRDGYDYNSVTKNPVNGRDLYSIRATVGFEPAPWFRSNFIWEHFNENDNRSRTGKQLCHRDESKFTIGSTQVVTNPDDPLDAVLRPALFSLGCKPGSLYDKDAFGTPNGLALAAIDALVVVGQAFPFASDQNGAPTTILKIADPYGGMMQSSNLREIASFRDPRYRAKADVFEFNADVDLGKSLTLSWQTAYNKDSVYSFQDFNRFNTVPVFVDSTSAFQQPSNYSNITAGGIFCDPQIGCSNTIGSFDISSSYSTQFSQEIRLQSSFDGPFNFSVGGNFTSFKTQDDYYVFSNIFTALAMVTPLNATGNQTNCAFNGFFFGSPDGPLPIKNSFCPYIDPNPVDSIDGQGHNYFRSSNPYKLHSYAGFGEAYYNITPTLKLTAGLRYTLDQKTFTPIPTQLLLAPTFSGGGYTGTGYPALPDIKLQWGEFTGRLGLDWRTRLSFTDQTLFYGFFSRGYKGGGMNPPLPGFAVDPKKMYADGWLSDSEYELVTTGFFNTIFPLLTLPGANYGPTFKPEFVNSFEIGSKNTMLGGALTLNVDAFYYDYKDYQVSQIRDRTAINENFDATIWGAEMQLTFAATRRLRFNANVGYLSTRISNGQSSIDPMNRTNGDPNYTVVKPWVQMPSNCVVPTAIAEQHLQNSYGIRDYFMLCGVGGLLGYAESWAIPIDPKTGLPYNVANYPELNGGAGIRTDVSGNQLPNSPHWTVNVGAEYTIPFSSDWSATIRGDGYWQAQSWARIYNLDPYDRLRGWTNFNLSVHVDGPQGLAIEAYVKNLFNSTPITDAFLNSDDSGLTTNVFTLDPRIIGFSVSKKF
jgi:iron complex outermembrane receptor protein